MRGKLLANMLLQYSKQGNFVHGNVAANKVHTQFAVEVFE